METYMDKIRNGIDHLLELSIRDKHPSATVVCTNGCFDILHPGHVALLAEAKSKGDILIVAINSDESIKRLKGTERPINTLEDRMIMLAALESVDYVFPFYEDTPLEVYGQIRPDVLVKGGDYHMDEIIGAEEVLADGGEVIIIALEEGYSTTSIIDKIKISGLI